MVDGCGGQYWVQWRPSRQIASSKDTNPYFLAFSAAFIILHSVPTSVAIVCNWSCCSRNMSEHVSHRKQLRTQRFSSDQSMWSPNRFSFLAHFGGRNHWRASPNPGRGFQQLSSVFTGHLYIYFYILLHLLFATRYKQKVEGFHKQPVLQTADGNRYIQPQLHSISPTLGLPLERVANLGFCVWSLVQRPFCSNDTKQQTTATKRFWRLRPNTLCSHGQAWKGRFAWQASLACRKWNLNEFRSVVVIHIDLSYSILFCWRAFMTVETLCIVYLLEIRLSLTFCLILKILEWRRPYASMDMLVGWSG